MTDTITTEQLRTLAEAAGYRPVNTNSKECVVTHPKWQTDEHGYPMRSIGWTPHTDIAQADELITAICSKHGKVFVMEYTCADDPKYGELTLCDFLGVQEEKNPLLYSGKDPSRALAIVKAVLQCVQQEEA